MTRSNRLWYPRYPGDYARKTAHLSMAEHGAYALLMDWYYSNSRALPLEWVQMHRICKAVAPLEQDAVQAVVEQFFVKGADGWHNERIDEEIGKKADISEKRRLAQEIREKKYRANAPKKPCKKSANAPTTTATGLEVSKDTSPESFLMPDGTQLSFDALFERFWQNFPATRKKGHKGMAKGELRKLINQGVSFETIGRGITKFKRYIDATGELNPDFFRWLKDGKFHDEYPDSPGKAGSRSNTGNSLESASTQAMDDQTRRPLSEERRKDLGILPDDGNE